jgi:hypothetical protein
LPPESFLVRAATKIAGIETAITANNIAPPVDSKTWNRKPNVEDIIYLRVLISDAGISLFIARKTT